ncbi:MAG: DedA family protein [Odoribacteraceae bacterium]|jgi:membrane-associated protein|nr:DedA family protein [Odoribacteraceae bacterium]
MEFLESLLDIFLHLDVHLQELVTRYDTWVYAILFAVIFCETGLVITPFLPGDSLLFVAGALVTTTGVLDVHVLLLLLSGAAILGDAVNYTIGLHFGRRLFRDPGSRLFRQSYLEKTHAFYERHGGKTIILARFVPIVRTFAPFVAGMGRMTYRRFAVFNVAGGVAWSALFLYAGFFFGEMPFVKRNLEFLMLAIIVISVVPVLVEWARGRARTRGNNVITK